MSAQARKLCTANEDLLEQLIEAVKRAQNDVAEHGTFAAVAILSTAEATVTAPAVGLASATVSLHKLYKSRKEKVELEQECVPFRLGCCIPR